VSRAASDVTLPVASEVAVPAADRLMLRLLRITPETLAVRAAKRGTGEQAAEKLFGTSILLSATRCLLSYIVFPVLAPLLGLATGVGSLVGIPIGVVAIVFDVLGIRRFWLANHKWRWPITFIYLGVIALLVILFFSDLGHLIH
jgi:hypothetical protein